MSDDKSLHVDGRPIRYSEALRFFEVTNRKPACPTCDYSGPWNLIIDPTSVESGASGDDPDMLVILFPSIGRAGTGSIRYISITCPQCAHSEFIQANDVANRIDSIGKKAHDE